MHLNILLIRLVQNLQSFGFLFLRNLSPKERHSIVDRLRNASVRKFQWIIGESIWKVIFFFRKRFFVFVH